MALTAPRLEWLVVAAVVALAAALRLYALGSLPPGLHGDEAIAGLHAERVLDEGWIGVYSPIPAPNGSPAGFFYAAALPVAAFEDPIVGVRLVPAVGGVLSILALFLVLRRVFGFATAALAAAVLAVMDWHLHFSRIAFPHSLWPLMAVVAAGAIAGAARSGTTRSWALAGAVVASGIYVYNAHLLLVAIAGLLVVGYVVRDRVRFWRRAAAFAGAAVVVALPLLVYAVSAGPDFLEHFRGTAISRSEEWQSHAPGPERLALTAERYSGFWRQICCNGTVDTIDGSGATPLVQAPVLVLALLGGVVAARRRPDPLVVFGLLVVLVMPFAAVATVDGAARRAFAMSPFIAMFAAVGGVSLLRALRTGVRRDVLPAMLVGAVALAATAYSITNYFRVVRAAPVERWIFAHELTEAALYLRALQDDTPVYFLSERWSVDYETRRYLAPRVAGEDRSAEFGRFDLTVAPAERPVFILLGPYRPLVDVLRRLYPRGRTVTLCDGDCVAYHVRP